jgi:hypothetical protein
MRSTNYIENNTQEGRILRRLREAGRQGVPAYEFAMPRPQGGEGILQYNARVFGLRNKGFNIINKDSVFYLVEEGQLPLI